MVTPAVRRSREILVYQSLYNATYGVNALTSIRLYRERTPVRFPRHFRQKATSIKRYITRPRSIDLNIL